MNSRRYRESGFSGSSYQHNAAVRNPRAAASSSWKVLVCLIAPLLCANNNNVIVWAIPTTLKSLTSHGRIRGGAMAPSSEHLLVVKKPKELGRKAATTTITKKVPSTATLTTEATLEITSESEPSENNITMISSAVAASTLESSSNTNNNKNENVSATKEDPRVIMLIRVLFLSYYASLGSLMPYLPVYYHSLGHGGKILGLIGAIKPLTTFLVAPFWGVVADKSDNPFTILKATFLISLAGQLLVGVRNDCYYIMAMVFLTALFNAPVKSLIDSMVMEHIQDQTQYGKLRLWGQMGFGLGSSGVGVLLSKSKGKAVPGSTSIPPGWVDAIAALPRVFRFTIQSVDQFWQSLYGYKLLFFSYAALSIPTWLAIQASQRLDKEKEEKEEKELQVQPSAENNEIEKQQKEDSGSNSNNNNSKMGEGLWLLLHSSDALLFFFLVFVIGVSSGCIENFAYVRIREVGGSGKEMGLSRLVSSIAGAPMFWFSGPLTQALGADKVFVLSLLSYCTRFIIYALMQNPLQGLPAEALRGLTFAGFWSTATVYAHSISPPGLHATMLMFLNAMYGGLGQSLGAIVGGNMAGRYGTVSTFLYSALANFGFVCCLVAYLRVRKDSNFKNPTPIVPQERPQQKEQEREDLAQEQPLLQVEIKEQQQR